MLGPQFGLKDIRRNEIKEIVSSGQDTTQLIFQFVKNKTKQKNCLGNILLLKQSKVYQTKKSINKSKLTQNVIQEGPRFHPTQVEILGRIGNLFFCFLFLLYSLGCNSKGVVEMSLKLRKATEVWFVEGEFLYAGPE